MKNKILLPLLLSTLFSIQAFAQVAMGKWRTHFAYNSVSQIAQSQNKVYGISDGALFSVDKLDGNIEIYTRLTGLNGSVISQIAYDESNNQLVIGYNNGNIDLITSGGIVNIPDFYNKVMNVNKNINDIYIHGDKAYLSCNFGIIVLNLKRREIAETYYIAPNAAEVNIVNTTVHDGHIYALGYFKTSSTTNEYHLYKGNLNNPNLVNYENWTEITNLAPGGLNNSHKILSFAGSLFMHSNFLLYRMVNDAWVRIVDSAAFLKVNATKTRMFASNEWANTYILDENFNVIQNFNGVQYSQAGEYDAPSNAYWFAGSNEGVILYKPDEDTPPEQFKPKGPAVNTQWEMKFAGEKLFIIPGRMWDKFYNRPGYIMIYENEEWTSIDYSEIAAITGLPWLDLVTIAIDPSDNTHFFAGSARSGLYEFKDNKFAVYHNFTNSTIDTHEQGNWLWQSIDGATFDNEGNLWFLNTYSPKSVKLFKKDRTWHEFAYPDFNNQMNLAGLLVSNQNKNQKWAFRYRYEPKILVFDDNGTFDTQQDDKSKIFKEFIDADKPSEKIKPESYHSMVQDKNGVIWVGTNKGPLLFHSTSKVFEDNYTCSRVKIPRNDGTNAADYLLENEAIKAIAIDGANRKWLGTSSSGLYLLSENGQETIQHFTTANSPLLSDEIISIAINPVTGEVFVVTGDGLMSYQSDAAEGEKTFDNAYAYPNPVRENHTGVITITGLIENTNVKITDLNGNLICETISNGSIATWDGKDGFGRKVNTGIYLALCVSEDGSQSTVVKIMVIN
ncbi:T9SS C-terminal target domain-containing protein [Paludibacter sp. 221]|uniref:type IX secretion system anionic LPS delivery protein PorZ n=1 Tax=Paludibacter sp. 221 TaxID=2302939 RepID=UPI0013CFF019|nr:two-component regulator propeller domain-containing protein [Paludibacter sp. 221]NDV45923.1 T9SS C-terminal target domain-containing protein [Paludibacter sp. 221]